MDLRHAAIEAYNQAQAERRAYLEREAAALAQNAAKVFAQKMGLDETIAFVTWDERIAISRGDPRIEARGGTYDGPTFFAITACPLCGEFGYRFVACLSDIGRAIKEGPLCPCQATAKEPDEPAEYSVEGALCQIADRLERISDTLKRIEDR